MIRKRIRGQRFDPLGQYVWRRDTTWRGDPVKVGDPVPADLSSDKRRLRIFWNSRRILAATPASAPESAGAIADWRSMKRLDAVAYARTLGYKGRIPTSAALEEFFASIEKA